MRCGAPLTCFKRFICFKRSCHWLCCVLYLLSSSGCSLLQQPSSPADSSTALAWTAVGREYLAEGDTQHARQTFEHARHFDDTLPALWHGLALCAQLEHNNVQAQTFYQRALALSAQRAKNAHDSDDSREYVALLNNHARLLYDEGATHEACAEFENAARYPGGIGNAVMAQNLTLCHTLSVKPASVDSKNDAP